MSCRSCTRRKPTLPPVVPALLSTVKAGIGYVAAKASGQADPGTVARREMVCRSCPARDQAGQRLFRVIGSREYCGQPRSLNVIRDDKADGCGCELGEKRAAAGASCPLGRW